MEPFGVADKSDEELVETNPPVDQSKLLYFSMNAAVDKLLDKSTKKQFDSPLDVGRHLHPLAYYVYMQNTYLDDWADFEPETVRDIFKGTEPNDDEILDYHGAWAVLRAHGGTITYDVFENIILAFNNRTPSRSWHQDISLAEMCHALTCIQTVLLLEWSDDIKTYIASKCFHEDFLVIRPEYEFIQGQPTASDFIDTGSIPLDSAYFLEDVTIDEYLGEKKVVFEEFIAAVKQS